MSDTQAQPRFVRIEDNAKYPNDGETCWWWDTARPARITQQPFVAVQVYCYKDPNNFVRVEDMQLLFTDQAEYYVVCAGCYSAYRHMQWSGSTRNKSWRQIAIKHLELHQKIKGWCEFCDPVFGNGGWLPD